MHDTVSNRYSAVRSIAHVRSPGEFPMDTREQTAQRLLDPSLRHFSDPDLEIDWEAPLDPGRYWIPPQRSSLYGTDLWTSMTRAQQIELTKHEVVSAASAGVW